MRNRVIMYTWRIHFVSLPQHSCSRVSLQADIADGARPLSVRYFGRQLQPLEIFYLYKICWRIPLGCTGAGGETCLPSQILGSERLALARVRVMVASNLILVIVLELVLQDALVLGLHKKGHCRRTERTPATHLHLPN
jgi:hypothetical protein